MLKRLGFYVCFQIDVGKEIKICLLIIRADYVIVEIGICVSGEELQ